MYASNKMLQINLIHTSTALFNHPRLLIQVPESSILVSSRWACPISSQVTDHWGELRNRTDEVHPVDPFHSLVILKNHSASVAFL